MNLFNRKTLARHIAKQSTPAASKIPIIKEWSELITSGRIYAQYERNLQGDFNAKIVQDVLGNTPPASGKN